MIRVGTSGWQYASWRGPFYPKGLPQSRWLERYAEEFDTVEVNASFYRLPEKRTFEDWARRTPDGFTFSVKASRYLTHILRLRDAGDAVDRFMERAAGLGAKLGPVLLQLPPNLHSDPASLRATLDRFPERVRVAVELRHDSWYSGEVRAILEQRGAALCLADRSGPSTPVWRTAGWTFLRMHAGRAHPHPCYGRRALRSWVERLLDLGVDACVFFNNDARACAIANARTFRSIASRQPLSV